MDLDEAGVISLDMIGRSIFLQQQRQLVVQHHFPQFPVGVITEKTDVNGAQNAQVIDGCGYHKRLSAENSSSSIITTLYSLSIVNNPALVINGTKVLKHVLTHKPDTPVMEL